MTETIENLFIYIATYIPLLSIIIFLVFYTRIKNILLFKVVFFYSIIELLTNIISLYASYKTIYQVYSFFTAAEYGLFAYGLFTTLKKASFKKVVIALSIGFAFFWFSYKFFSKRGFVGLDSIPIGVETILILAFAFCYLYEQMDSTSQTLIYNQYHFWITTGIMLYLAGSFFIYIFLNNVDQKTAAIYWMFTNIFTCIKHILFAISIFVYLKGAKKKSTNKNYYLYTAN